MQVTKVNNRVGNLCIFDLLITVSSFADAVSYRKRSVDIPHIQSFAAF